MGCLQAKNKEKEKGKEEPINFEKKNIGNGGIIEAKAVPSWEEKRKKLNPADYIFSNRENECLIKSPG